MSRQKKFILQENEIPTQWYNIQADMVNKPLPPLNPSTHKPLVAGRHGEQTIAATKSFHPQTVGS
jgi:predicted alternative tryptophan synthase beta-subunit